jgi:plastocyanin
MGWRATAALIGLLAVLIASGTARAADQTVSIAGFAFSPGTVTVTEGDTVTWTNDDSTAHTATGDGFDTERLDPGQSATITFSTAGTFAYGCAIHSQMRGTVVVEAAAQAPTAAPGGAAATPPRTDVVPVAAPPRPPDAIESIAVLLALFGVSMLALTLWTSRRDHASRSGP